MQISKEAAARLHASKAALDQSKPDRTAADFSKPPGLGDLEAAGTCKVLPFHEHPGGDLSTLKVSIVV